MLWLAHALGAGTASCLLFFPLAYLALKKQLQLQLSTWKILLLFFICAPLVGIAQGLMQGGPELSYLGIISTLFVPPLICAGVIFCGQRLIGKKQEATIP